MKKEAYGCFICGHVVGENKIMKVYMSGCGETCDYIHICKVCVAKVNSGDADLSVAHPGEKEEDTPETKEKHKNTVNKLLEDVDLSNLDNKKGKKNKNTEQK